jgi:hypothetical protein
MNARATKLSRRSALAGLSVTAAAGVAALPVGAAAIALAGADPIFALLAEHQATMKVYFAAAAISGNLSYDSPEWKAAEAVTQSAIEREHAAIHALFTAQPTTLAGVAALLAHVGQGQFLDATEEAEDTGDFETVLSTWAQALSDHKLAIASKGFLRRVAATMHSLLA